MHYTFIYFNNNNITNSLVCCYNEKIIYICFNKQV